jgi:hypothetical protein
MPEHFAYVRFMSFTEILEEIPNLSFAQRQELVRRAIALDEDELTSEENALLDARMENFRHGPGAGIPIEHLREHVAGRLSGQ